VSTQEAQPLVPFAEIRYVGIGEITIYFVSDDELHLLERGGTSATLLNLAIFFMSTAASFFASLLLSPPPSIRTFIVMVVLTTATAIAGLILIFLWRSSSRDVTDTISRVRAARKVASGGEVVQGTRIS
jgi:hypothetical protein